MRFGALKPLRCNASIECGICRMLILHQSYTNIGELNTVSQSVFALHISIKMMSQLQNFMTIRSNIYKGKHCNIYHQL